MKKIYWLLAMLVSLGLIFTSAAAYDSPWDFFKGPQAAEPAEPAPQEGPSIDVPEINEPVAGSPAVEGPAPEEGPVRESIADGLIWPEAEPEPVQNFFDPNANLPTEPDITGPAPDFMEPTSRQGSFRIDSVTVLGMDDQTSRQILDLIEGLRFEFRSQKGPTPHFDLDMFLNDKNLLTYSLQKTDPYYVSSNFLGSDTYLITDEDKFEEKLTAAFYALVERMSEGNTELPPIEQVYEAIETIRSGGVNPISTDMMAMTGEVDTSAFMLWFMTFMTRIGMDEGDPSIDYRYTDITEGILHYNWPERGTLPAPAKADSATTVKLTGKDIADLLEALQKFFTDNPELAESVNQMMKQYMQGAEVPGGDYISALLSQARESVAESMDSMVINFRMDQAASGEPARVTLDFGGDDSESSGGFKATITMGSDDNGSAIDIAADLYAGQQIMPLLRALLVTNTGSRGFTGNVLLSSPEGMTSEYLIQSNFYESGFGSEISDTGISYYLGDAGSGEVTLLRTDTPNAYGDADSVTQISLVHNMDGQPAFTLSAVAEGTTADPIPALSPDDAVYASDMTDADYDTAAQNIMSQLMMLMMNIM